MKATAVAPSNIAFIKYWGRRDEALRLPANGSISMNLSNLTTKTTVEFDVSLKQDDVVILSKAKDLSTTQKDSSPAERDQNDKNMENKMLIHDPKVISHLDRIRKLAGISEKARVVSENNFPQSTGLSSSASGYAALTLAASNAAGLDLSEKELSILSRLGSGSACRSIPDGFVEWLDGETSETSFAVSIFKEDYFDIVDIVCVLTTEKKDVPTSQGQTYAESSPFFAIRQSTMNEKIRNMKEALYEKNFQRFGELTESEALEMHAIMMTSKPSLFYVKPETITMMKQVQKWRNEGLPVYFTLNTGQNIHLLCEKKHAYDLTKELENMSIVKQIIRNTPHHGARIVT